MMDGHTVLKAGGNIVATKYHMPKTCTDNESKDVTRLHNVETRDVP